MLTRLYLLAYLFFSKDLATFQEPGSGHDREELGPEVVLRFRWGPIIKQE